MQFENSQMLWLVPLTLPLLIAFLWWGWRQRLRLTAQFVRSRLLAHLTVGVSRTRQKIRLALLAAAVAAVLVALARPQWGFTWEETRQYGLDVLVAVDTSRSMLAQDVAPNRLTRAKLAALDLMRLAKSDRLGLIVFAGSAFLQCPLTLDDDAFRQSVNILDPGIIPEGGTDLTEAIETARTSVKNEGEASRPVLVLLTDGEDHAGGAVKAAEQAAAAGIHVFTVGIGTPDGDLLRQPAGKAGGDYIKDPDGHVVKSRLNEPLLQEIATAGGGFYLRLSGAKTMDTLYEQGLAPLLPQVRAWRSEGKPVPAIKIAPRPKERFQWPLALAVLLLLVEFFLPDRKRVRRGAHSGEPHRSAVLPGAALVLVSLWPVAGQASPQQALRSYERRQYDDAQRQYEQALKRKPGDARLQFNAGDAAYQAKEYSMATNRFNQALTATDLAVQQGAYYNLGNSLYRLGEGTADLSRKKAAWEQALVNFKMATSLKTNDADAQFNLDFLRQKLEELKQQQAQSRPSGSNDPPEQAQSQSSPSSPDKDATPQTPPDSAAQKSDGQQPGEQNQSASSDKDSNGQKESPSSDAGQGKQRTSDPAKSTEGTDSTGAAAGEPKGQMTVQQAQQLLDAHKSGEQALVFAPPEKNEAKKRTRKDW